MRALASVRRLPAEAALALGFAGFTLILSATLGLPIALPNGQSAAFVGVHYLYPLLAIAAWAALALRTRREALAPAFLIALPCYALILIAHFNLKLWIPHVNPVWWDAQYWAVDRAFYPLVAGAKWLRLALAPAVPLGSNFYMFGFIALFYVSLGYHALYTPHAFRRLVLGILSLQIIGSLAYFVAPAAGPFLFEAGVEPPATQAQQHMLGLLHANSAGGAQWLASNASRELTGGLAAMPSLHAGGSLLFVLFAARYAPRLQWVFAPLFVFITLDAIANRWHYLIDIPVGWAVALAAFGIAHALDRRTAPTPSNSASPAAGERPIPAGAEA